MSPLAQELQLLEYTPLLLGRHTQELPESRSPVVAVRRQREWVPGLALQEFAPVQAPAREPVLPREERSALAVRTRA